MPLLHYAVAALNLVKPIRGVDQLACEYPPLRQGGRFAADTGSASVDSPECHDTHVTGSVKFGRMTFASCTNFIVRRVNSAAASLIASDPVDRPAQEALHRKQFQMQQKHTRFRDEAS